MGNLQFDRVKGHVYDLTSNSMLLLTSSIIAPSFIFLCRIVLELSWKQADRRTDRWTYKTIAWSILVEYLITMDHGCHSASVSVPRAWEEKHHFSGVERAFPSPFCVPAILPVVPAVRPFLASSPNFFQAVNDLPVLGAAGESAGKSETPFYPGKGVRKLTALVIS